MGFGETDLTSADVFHDLIRLLFSALDRPAYWLLTGVYLLFFNVASVDVFSNATVMKFYGRIQVILGVFMMFQLSLTILKGIVDPDSFVGDKGSGKKIITKVVTSLLLLTILMPIAIPSPKNEYEIQLNNNGLLFGTLFSLQHRILANNTIGRLVLGTTDTNNSFSAANEDSDVFKSGRIFTAAIIKGFYRINLKPEEERDDTYLKEGRDPATYNENRICTDIPDDAINTYSKIDASPDDIINMVNETCSIDAIDVPVLSYLAGRKKYAFKFIPIIPTIVAIVFVFILLSFTIDVAVRTVKLSVLRLIAPIPIIMYMDPKDSKDSAFNSWIKALSTTYLDLFIRLATVYFVIFIIQETIAHGIVMDNGSGPIMILTYIAVWIGLFVFAKQAPKFIKQVLGMKDDAGGKLFSGFSELMGLGALGMGTVGAFNASRNSSRLSDMERGRELARQQGLEGDAATRYAENYANSRLNRGKHLAAGIFGGASGAVGGFTTAMNAKEKPGKAVSDYFTSRNSKVLSSGRSGGSFLGAVGSRADQLVRGESSYDRMEAGWKAREQQIKNDELRLKSNKDSNAHRQSIMNRAKSKAVDSDKTVGTYNSRTSGTITANYRDFHSAYEAALSHGTGVHTQYVDASGHTISKRDFESLSAADQGNYTEHSWFSYNGSRINMAEANSIDLGLKDANAANFYEQVVEYETSGGRRGFSDSSIEGDRRAYREATGRDLEATYDGANGLKATYGSENNANQAESDRLNRERESINNERQGYDAQRAQADAKRFNSGGKS